MELLELKCKNCDRLLFKYLGYFELIEIKCRKCRFINKIGKINGKICQKAYPKTNKKK